MAQQVKELAAKLDDLRLIFRTTWGNERTGSWKPASDAALTVAPAFLKELIST